MNKIFSYICKIILFSLFFISNGFSGIGSALDSWFSTHNYSNHSKPAFHKGQSAGYFSAGSYSYSNEISQPLKLVSVQTPSFSAGCGGIDIYGGGFSAIDTDQFIENLRNIAQNAKSLAWTLALQIVSPQITETMKTIQNWADKYLNRNINSCEAAANLSKGALKLFGARENSCIMKRIDAGASGDWSSAEHACSTGGEIKESEGDKPNFLDFISDNIAWNLLMDDAVFSENLDLSELIMNITGTMIIENHDSGKISIRYIDSAIEEGKLSERFINIYNGIINGDESTANIKIYKCKDRSKEKGSCINMSKDLEEISPDWKPLKFKIHSIISKILDSIYNDKPLEENSEEVSLISNTSIPIYKMLLVSAAYYSSKDYAEKELANYSTLIIEDIVLKNISAILEKLSQLISNSKEGQGGDKMISFKKSISNVLSGITKLRIKNRNNIESYHRMQERIMTMERIIVSKLGGGFAANLTWEKSL